MDVEGTDRLSSLPDDLIHKILSFLDITDAIGSSVLSPRWRYIWTSMPYLRLSSEDFTKLPAFSKFVANVLSRRDNLAEVYSVELSFRCTVSQAVKRFLSYAVSHNVQQLSMVCFPEKDFKFPLSLVSSRSLKHLSLTAYNSYRNRRRCFRSYSITPTSICELPALTTLDLHSVAICNDEADTCVGIFSKCANLKNLALSNFTTMGSDCFSIRHPRLSNLTLEHDRDVKMVNVVAPQLENLTIRFCKAEHVISAPNLASLFYKGDYPLHLSTDGFHSLERADICVSDPEVADAHQIVYLLQQLYNVHFLTLNLEIVELLNSSSELVLHQPSPFMNLKRLNMYLLEQASKEVAMSTELIKNYLLGSSPKNNFTMVLCEEIAANKLMAELQVLLKEEKDNIKTNSSHVVPREKTPVESHKPKKLKIGGNMTQIKEHWENMGAEIQLRKEKACLIISMLQRIEELLAKLPVSNRARIQPCFSSLCEEASVAITKLANCIKIQCDKNLSCSSVCFHKLATALESSP
ncbi:FBD-associated F-box protein At5g60610-like [Bidens hawaiensis]|uniref:FBD-associated F-box protein At5g60610-like n=1 Tax=Bidens hawaiensis TaxID=980011 RepID=UPI004049D6F8